MSARNPPLCCTLACFSHYSAFWFCQPEKTTLRRGKNPACGLNYFFFSSLRWTLSLPSCLWSQRIFPSLPGSRLTFFLSRCKFSTLTTRQPMVEFYLLTFPRFPLRKRQHKSYLGKNRTHDFRTSRCADYLLDHSRKREGGESPAAHPPTPYAARLEEKNRKQKI